MSKEDIGLDRIQERLKGSKTELPDRLPVEIGLAPASPRAKPVNLIFLGGAAALVAAVFTSVFWLSGVMTASEDPNPPAIGGAFRSVVDEECAARWVENARNDTALICYLTKDIERLCQSDEQKHLASIINHYRAQAILHDLQLVKSGMMAASAIGNEDPEMMRMARAYTPAAGSPLAEPVAKWAKQNIETYMHKFRDLAGVAIPPGLFLPRVREEVLARHIQEIGEKGYMKKWHFGQFVDPLAGAAFENLQTGAQACAS